MVGSHNPDLIYNVQLNLDRFGDLLGAAECTGVEGIAASPGPTSFLRVPNTLALNPPQLSINLWFKHTKTQGDDGDPSSAQFTMIGNHVQIAPGFEPGYEVFIQRQRPDNTISIAGSLLVRHHEDTT